jgi:DNA-binding CsgD family transcriptional regulator
MATIKHYGILRRSGRYPWGSGKEPYQSGGDFLSVYNDLKKQGLSQTEIAANMGMNTREMRQLRSIANAEKRAADAALAYRLKAKGYSNVAIGKRMGINESSVRSLLDPSLKEKAASTAMTAEVLKDAVDKKKYIDIGVGVEHQLGVARTKLLTATAMLKEQGYVEYNLKVPQLGTGKFTTVKVLCPPGTTFGELSRNRDKISLIDEWSEDGGRTFLGLEPIRSVDSSRIYIRYDEEGGRNKDGVIEIRRGVEDLDMGDASYAQVRVGVDGKYYMKGMAMYSNDIPAGYDMVYNTTKKRGTPANEVYKEMSDDPDNPFGSTLRQKHYIDANGKEQLSALNMVGAKPGAGEEGAWADWSRTLSSQILSKQSTGLAKQQLALALKQKQDEYDEIMSLTNPTVKKALLKAYADSADSAAVHLKAAALPRQANQVLLPFNSIKDNEVYAPNFRNGETVVLIRHPHGGTFEIPTLTVNNKNAEAKGLIGAAKDAVGINPKVANILSGADFDGDTVLVIPNNTGRIRTSKALAGLKDFDTKAAYPGYPGMKTISPHAKQMEMGKVSNLITDMTIRGASQSEIARAVRHSMVIIDAEKHGLNYKQSAIDNGIGQLKEKYQGASTAGATTLISRAKSTVRVPVRKQNYKIDPKTGKKIYEETGETYVNAKGKVVKRTTKSYKLAEVDDAYKLSSGTKMESLYADHSNSLKALANKARKSMLSTKDIPYSSSAAKTFDPEVRSLKKKLDAAERNAPKERKAQIAANKVYKAKKADNPHLTEDQLKKIKYQALEASRTKYGAKKPTINITDREWLAIQAGAVSPTRLRNILGNTDTAKLKERALPRKRTVMTPTKMTRARTMAATGYTPSEIADALGVAVSTVTSALEG